MSKRLVNGIAGMMFVIGVTGFGIIKLIVEVTVEVGLRVIGIVAVLAAGIVGLIGEVGYVFGFGKIDKLSDRMQDQIEKLYESFRNVMKRFQGDILSN